jgi:hypothetical protein
MAAAKVSSEKRPATSLPVSCLLQHGLFGGRPQSFADQRHPGQAQQQEAEQAAVAARRGLHVAQALA